MLCKGILLVSKGDLMLDKVLRIGQLYDFYGALLTDKQQRCLEMHFLNDESLAEIAEEFQVSRQAVHDILRRCEQILTAYESKLGLVERYCREQAVISQVVTLISELPQDVHQSRQIKLALDLLQQLLHQGEDV